MWRRLLRRGFAPTVFVYAICVFGCHRMSVAESKVGASPEPAQPSRGKSRSRQPGGASPAIPLPQVNLLRWLQLSLGYDLSLCSPTELGLELPEVRPRGEIP